MKRCKFSFVLMIFAVAGTLAMAQPADDAELAPAIRDSYVIGIEDVIRVVVWNEPDLTVIQKVRPDGRITVSLVNDVMVAGKTPEEVRGDVTAALADFIRDPNVTVMVDEINSFRVYFLGEINQQGPVQFYRPTRFLQGIATAGGLTEFAKKSIVVLREDGPGEKRITIDFKAVWDGEAGHENLFLKPGDTILVK